MKMLNMYETKTFSQVFPELEDFTDTVVNEYSGYAAQALTQENLTALYYMLYAKYGNTPMINYSEEVFKSKIVSTIFTKGPTWQRKLKLQADIRALSEDDLKTGATTILNQALHPEEAPTTGTTEELDYINQQNVSKHKRSKLDAYAFLMDLLKTDVTESFLQAFSPLFSKFVDPDILHIYISKDEEEEEDEE